MMLTGGCLCGAVRYQVVAGATRTYTSTGSSGLPSVRHFCPECGSLLFGMAEAAPESVSIYVGSLDDPSIFRPDAALFTHHRYGWDVGVAALTEFEAMPTMGEAK